jgi:hypothetical protein
MSFKFRKTPPSSKQPIKLYGESMKELAFLIIALMMESTTFALPIHKKYQTHQVFASQEHPVELNDFPGEWVGSCTRDNEGETSKKIQLTITQNPKQRPLRALDFSSLLTFNCW